MLRPYFGITAVLLPMIQYFNETQLLTAHLTVHYYNFFLITIFTVRHYTITSAPCADFRSSTMLSADQLHSLLLCLVGLQVLPAYFTSQLRGESP